MRRQIETIRAALDNLPDGVVVADRDGRFLHFNPAAEKMLGIGAKEIDPAEWIAAYGCYLPDKVTPFPLERLPLIRAMNGDEVSDEVIYIRNAEKPSGVWISVSGKPIIHEDGSLWGGLAYFRDISKHKRAEEHLQSASSRLSALVENQKTGILVESESRRIMLVNQAFCDLFAVSASPSELLGTDCSEYAERAKTTFRDPDGFVGRIEQLLREKTIAMNDELCLADGRVFQRDYIPVFVDQEYRGHLWQYRDITKRLKAREKVRVYERLCTALEQTADSIVITDKDGVIEYVNPAFETTTGYSRDEVIGNTPRILKSGRHDEKFYRNLWAEVKAGRPFRGTIINRRKTGELYWAQQTITPMKEDGEKITHFVSVLKDITELIEKKEQEAKLSLAREVQQRFYKVNASVPGFDIAGAAYPADETGGDYFDFVTMPDGCLLIAVGDVSGHGINAALVMAETRAYVRSYAKTSSDVAWVMHQVNQALTPDLDEGDYVTLLLCRLDPQKRTVTFASAGHVPAYLLDANGEVCTVLGGTGHPLGLFMDSEFSSGEVSLSDSGQVLLLPTDGVTDSRSADEEPYGIERALKYVGTHRKKSARAIVKGLYRAARAHEGNQPQWDDITAVVVKVK
ncbi:MAG: SpoIIE family protein phosphatase [Candidatus Zixiibacteriota bacterium]|nr:MAG: SpoIIE family protein phosphatase [candidate division Zixibacteria bacterium]